MVNTRILNSHKALTKCVCVFCIDHCVAYTFGLLHLDQKGKKKKGNFVFAVRAWKNKNSLLLFIRLDFFFFFFLDHLRPYFK